MQKINIIQFLPYFPPHKGGVETVAEEFGVAYLSKGYGEVINVVFDIDQNIEYRIQNEGLEAIINKNGKTIGYKQNGYSVYLLEAFDIIPNFPVPKFWKKEFWKILSSCHLELDSGSLKKENTFYDSEINSEGQKQKTIIQTHTRFFLSSFLGGLFAKYYKLKWVHVEHGSDYVKLGSTVKSKIAYIYDKIIGKWIFKKADSIVGISEGVKKFILQLSSSDLIRRSKHIENKIQIIYNGINFNPGKKLENSEKIIIGFVGRLVHLKGIDLLLESFKNLSGKYNNLELQIVGNGDEKEKLENYAKENNLNNVTFLGLKDREYIANDFLPKVDILVNPSFQEGLPTTVLEGLLSGCVVVATDVGGTKEISNKDDLIIVEKGNLKSLEKGVENAILNYRELRGKSREFVKEKFDWNKNIEKYFGLYNDL